MSEPAPEVMFAVDQDDPEQNPSPDVPLPEPPPIREES